MGGALQAIERGFMQNEIQNAAYAVQVVAGVIGTKKFIYDLWGDTVNTASRMESQGLPGRIQVMQRVYERLQDKYRFEPRGAIAIKGKGEMNAYLLGGPGSSQA